MASDRLQAVLSGLLTLAVAGGAWAHAAPAATTGGIFTCIDSSGRRLTADRPIPECVHKEQQVLNRDGSVRAVVPPTLTAEERAEKENRDRVAADARAAQADALRRDRNLVARYPTEAAHARAREAAVDTVRMAIKATDARLRELEAERKPLRDEAEFYPARALPPRLKAAMDANEAAVEAQRASSANQEAELVRINRLYDNELERLRRLWSGAQPGSLGPLPGAPAGPVPLRPSKVSTRPAAAASAALR